jgi:hypothetical protein
VLSNERIVKCLSRGIDPRPRWRGGDARHQSDLNKPVAGDLGLAIWKIISISQLFDCALPFAIAVPAI